MLLLLYKRKSKMANTFFKKALFSFYTSFFVKRIQAFYQAKFEVASSIAAKKRSQYSSFQL